MTHDSDAGVNDRHRPTRPRSNRRKDARRALRRRRTQVLLSAAVSAALVATALALVAVQGGPDRGTGAEDPDLARLASSATTTAAAAPVTQQVIAPVVADTYVVASRPSATNGSKKWAFATKSENRAFLRFDTARVVPAGMTVKAATLRVFVLNIDTAAAGFTAHRLADGWSESSTSSSNRPTFDPAAASAPVAVPADRQWVSLSIDPTAVRASATTSLELLHSVSRSQLQVATRESSRPPTLSLTLAPATAATTTSTTTTTTTVRTTTTTTSPSKTTEPAKEPSSDVAESGDLPFDLPSTSTLRSSKKLVFAHYFTPFPLSIDNKDPDEDYYERAYLDPMGESGKHKSYGGFLRDRPIGRNPVSGDYKAKDLRTEVRQAISAGLDGFAVDVLSLTSSNWTRTQELLEAAHDVDPGFKIMIMPDMTTLDDDSPAALAAGVAKLGSYPSAFHLPDGRLVVSPFKAENHSASWWKQWLSLMKSQHGVDVAFVPVFLDWQKYADDYAGISYGFSHWGLANADAADSTAKHARLAHDLGKIWMAPVRTQDVRPGQSIFDESDGTRTLRGTWKGVIEGNADWVQIPTWNDYTEGSAIAPSAHHGWSFLDISAYYLTRWKTGSYPTVKRDGVYVVHRRHPYRASPTFPQTKLMKVRSSSPDPVDQVEVVTFLKSAATVTVKVGSSTHTWEAEAGVSTKDFPLGTGTVAASVERSGSVTTSVTSPFKVTGSPYIQDLEYTAAGSLR